MVTRARAQFVREGREREDGAVENRGRNCDGFIFEVGSLKGGERERKKVESKERQRVDEEDETAREDKTAGR